MKQIIWAALWLCLSVQLSFAQQLSGTLMSETHQPVAYANISLINSTIGTTSDADGVFNLQLAFGTYELEISALGYVTKRIAVTVKAQSMHLDIKMKEDLAVLDEVVVSASREQQQRTDVPAAISVIGAETIQQTKAFGIDQLVNQVSGVYMSTSRVASNEQHFMAVRSPISTRGLFLYLEDGLQIRPTSVFNHNALLEMNALSYQRIEVLKGPASSIYGSEAIGGSFNFLTKDPSLDGAGSLGFQINDMGLKRYELEVSKQTSEHFGFYLGTQYSERSNGPIEHSDYEKFALTFKGVYTISDRLNWTNVLDIVDYRSDMTGSLSEADYTSGNFESDQTFTERDALAFRWRSTLSARWNDQHKTSVNVLFRDNKMDQNPSYRIRQFREMGQLTGFGSGEVNSNQFNSIMGLVQHKMDFNFLNASLIVGGTLDYSPQDYVSEKTDVIVDVASGKNIDFSVRSGDYILNYEADIFNYAGFFQYEISPLEKLKITAALRYDRFEYDYQNRMLLVGDVRSKDSYENWTPKLGVNYNFTKTSGIYANYSQGFSPPQVSTLYRNRNELRDIKPSVYDNYEVGGYWSPNQQWQLDAAMYILNGKNTLITLRDENDVFFNTNAGETRSYGVEYGISYRPHEQWFLRHQGSYANHKYVSFFDRGIDYSNTTRETAPKLLGTTTVTYKPITGLSITAEHEMVGKYNTSFENQVEAEDGALSTATYDGHHVVNLRASYRFKNYEIWGHFLNVFDELYAARASYNRFRGENSYTIGNPRAVHFGVKVHL